ncbi:peptidylprolyl isomerase [Coxiella endosymbiont of Amblyomma sculptum]|uniref:SurA N-terminal domain-containing protein n=1 Tax=Coxiella endosymbiont of Amblyomma sculptum TaxID=2487929 RepID=UPI00132F2554|nr:SurA N-terminal domain-containing protein [Coxiella endosymbiont of Amblyomma sculptum]QHG92393.1 peptidylprolyl isomerase [Coxiella endosymbiont of Amblyomma sculptum]
MRSTIEKTVLRRISQFIVMSLLMINSTVGTAQSFSHKPGISTVRERLLDQIVAVINNEVITQSEFNRALASAKQQFIQHHIPIPNEKIFRKQTMDQLIYQKLQLQLAKTVKIRVSSKEVNTVIANMASQNQLSQSTLKKKVFQKNISYQEFRNQIKEQLLIAKLERQMVANNIVLNKEDAVSAQRKYQKTTTPICYHIAEILIAIPENPTQNQINYAKDKAYSILKKLNGGLNFESEMSVYSGTDFGWRLINDLPKLFINSIKKMKSNDITGPIKAPNGFHLIKLLGKKTQNIINDQKIQQVAYQKKFAKALQQWLRQLRCLSYICICIHF